MDYCYEFPRPALTADVVCICADEVLLIERGGEPFAGCWALPGGFVDEGESPVQAAARELSEEAGVNIDAAELVQVGAFGDPGRDPRGWVVSVAFAAKVDRAALAPRAGDDAARYGWHALGDLPGLAFDHGQIIEQAVARLETAAQG